MAETPTLRLTLGADADANRNWQILDDTMHRLAKGQQIPDDLNILGSLVVRDNLNVGGTSTLQNLTASTLTAQNGTFSGAVGVTGALQAGSLVLPAQSLDSAALQKLAAVQGAWIGGVGALVTLSATPQQLALVTCDPGEDTGRYEIVIAQGTLRVGYGTGTSPSVNVQLELRRGTTPTQTRTLAYSAAAATPTLVLDAPFTMVRLSNIADLTTHDWSVWGTGTISGGAIATVPFAQMHVLQLR
jgi:hypothetical protein